MNRFISLFIILLIVSAGCSTTEKTTKENGDEGSTSTDQPIFNLDPDLVEDYLMDEMTESERELFETRSALADQFVTVEQDMPEIFLKDVEQDNDLVDQYAGFRVQLLSTRSVADADSTKDNFRLWADENIEGYSPEVYVIFRQPYYKVRTGDFRNQRRANQFSRLLKNDFPNAWVVHDRIEPQFLPADTTEIRKVSSR
ncbi:SPOR domain-containing protein [Rhodohalobacter sp. 614A]|uniref:SPOR domain-containing protein n=1 Tax=Rhodohalobacter sp. 614A TaxID=2908649 RepID=UPI001F44F890|nr:SPOR domain-containing protein [Rhodohalobacter sp. 614A]